MERLKFSMADIKYVTTLIRWHMYSYKSMPSDRSYIKFFNELESANINILDYILLIYSDPQGNRAKQRIKFANFLTGSWLYQKWLEIKMKHEPLKVSDLEIDGNDVMRILNLSSGKRIGEILNKLFELVSVGEISNKKFDLQTRLLEWKI